MILTAAYLLFAASAILIPIAIHLWNKRQGKTVKVGSLRWLEASASNRWSSIKLNNFWLLVLRCLILILLVVALAQPVWMREPQKPKGAKAIVVGEELLYTSALKPIKPTIDSLLQRGYTLNAYTSDLREIPQEEWQQIRNRTQDSTLAKHGNYWALLPALAAKYKNPQDSVWLFTSDQQQYFTSSRPDSLPKHIRWIPLATEASINWLQAAIQTTPDSLLLLLGQTSREGTSYSKYKIDTSAQSINLAGNQQMQLQRQQDTLVATVTGKSNKVKIQSEPLKVTLLADEAQQGEARYIKAALQAIGSYTGLPISISADTSKADWVFWLRQEPIPENMARQVRQGTKVWVQAGQQAQPVQSSLTGLGGTVIRVNQLTPKQPEQDKPVWLTVSGEALLTSKLLGRGVLYTYRSGFGPAWSEIGQSAQLPELLLPLLLPQTKAKYDYRALPEPQLLPVSQVQAVSESTTKSTQTDLLKWFVLAAFVLFLIERILANRRSKV